MKAINQTYHCQMLGQDCEVWNLQCHLHIFQPHAEMQVVVIKDMGFEMGWFIPHIIERLIDNVVSEFHLDPAQVVWIEHYTSTAHCASTVESLPATNFSQVTFAWQNGHAVNLQWAAIAPQTAEALISSELQLLSA